MESQPQNPEFRNNPENYHTCKLAKIYVSCNNGLMKIMYKYTINNFSHHVALIVMIHTNYVSLYTLDVLILHVFILLQPGPAIC